MPRNIVQTRYGADMDIRHYKLSREELMQQILEDVKASQIFAGRNLPDKLFMTTQQFQLLETDLQEIENTDYRLFVTPLNVMEVWVNDN